METLPSAPVLETPRLRLRPFCSADADALYAVCRNPIIGDLAGWPPHECLADSCRVLDEVFIGKESVWAVTGRDTGRLIGSVGLIPDPKRENAEVRMLGYWLDESCWGRGLMSEAARAVVGYGFDTLGVSMITVSCYAHNERSRRLIERLGFLPEGTLHAAVRDHRGTVHDLLCFYLPSAAWDRGEDRSCIPSRP